MALILLAPAMASAQDDEHYTLRWALAGGLSVATPSGNRLTIANTTGCNTCGRTIQRVIGADHSTYHGGLNVAGDIKLNMTIRGELMYNHSYSDFAKPPARSCIGFRCWQDRKALKDDSYFLGGGVEWAPWKKWVATPYVTTTLGLAMNRVRWTWDATGDPNAKLDGNARSFGSYTSSGLGVRVRTKTNVVVYAETRRFFLIAAPGTALASFSLGLQYWSRFRNYGY